MTSRTKRTVVQSFVAFAASLSVMLLGGVALAGPADATTADGRHTSGVVWTLSGPRYETYWGAGPILSDGGHWDTWSSVRWPLGGDKRVVHLRHYGGQ